MDKMWIHILIIGLLPAFFWVFFWLREDKDSDPEPTKLIVKTFIAGGVAAFLALIIQAMIIQFQLYKNGEVSGVFAFAFVEEILKFFVIYEFALKSRFNNERMDPVLYMIIGAIGFSAVENIFYLFDYIHNSEYIKSMIDGSYRFVGSTLVHTISSAFIGLGCAAMFFKPKIYRFFTILIGLTVSILAHSIFNFLVSSGDEFYKNLAFYLSWVSIVILLVIFEYLRRDQRIRPRSSVRHLFYKKKRIKIIRKDFN